eukprot:CAMPEP_0116927058 /NCGR_PEP_ID=MMETSP0467-20121206/25107_1 /TAXON_ID=283647 /ORGANISM="Mesodinium pulex, Strain SPMC105" /LENGTH=142 /DNA_ID=CAMNT_0004606459 /DNA_START=186 /DNA_END=614 /DNA_ORIENTATION=-
MDKLDMARPSSKRPLSSRKAFKQKVLDKYKPTTFDLSKRLSTNRTLKKPNENEMRVSGNANSVTNSNYVNGASNATGKSRRPMSARNPVNANIPNTTKVYKREPLAQMPTDFNFSNQNYNYPNNEEEYNPYGNVHRGRVIDG